MDRDGVKGLLAAVIEQAVADWRWSAASKHIDAVGHQIYRPPIRNPTTNRIIKHECVRNSPSDSLHSFFHGGGLETVLAAADLKINAGLIRTALDQPRNKYRL